MNTETNRSVQKIFDRWQSEDRELEVCIAGVRDWMREVNQLGIPHFGETATRLRPLRERLVQHFDREDELISQIADSHPSASPRVDDLWGESLCEHSKLLAKLDDLIERLNALDPSFASWTAAMDEVDTFVYSLEQHEAHEAKTVKAQLESTPSS